MLRIPLLSLFLVAGLAAQVTPPAPPATPVGWWSDLMAVPEVPMTRWQREAEAYRGRTVRATVVMKESIPHPGGLFTRVPSTRYVAFALWADEAPLWRSDVYDAPLMTAFAAKGSDAERILRRTLRYGRLNVTGKIVEVIGGRPWWVMTEATELDGAYDDAGLATMVKAYRLKELRRYEAAAEEFGRAMNPRWPLAGRAAATLEMARTLAMAGRRDEALLKYVAALALQSTPETKAEYDALLGRPTPTSRPAPRTPSGP